MGEEDIFGDTSLENFNPLQFHVDPEYALHPRTVTHISSRLPVNATVVAEKTR